MSRTTASLACLAFLVSGCTVLEKELDAPLERDRIQLVVGETRHADVLRALGPPAKLGTLGDGFGFLYEHLTIREVQVGVGFLSWFRFSPGWARGEREMLVLVFDDEGVLRGHGAEDEAHRLGSGVVVHWKVQAESAVDTTQVEADIEPNVWGMRLLRPLPVVLNDVQSLENGRGFELRGRFQAAGQEALELR